MRVSKCAILGSLRPVSVVLVILLTAVACSGRVPETAREVTAIPRSSGEILLKWARVPDATQYEILKREGPSGPYQVLGRMERQSLSLLNTGLRNHTTYFFKLRACNRTGCSGFSQEVSAEAP